MRKYLAILIAFMLAVMAVGTALSLEGKQLKSPPVLTETQKLQVQNAVQKIQIAQLQMQAAQNDLQKAGQDAQALFKSLTVEGYELNIQTLEYVKQEK